MATMTSRSTSGETARSSPKRPGITHRLTLTLKRVSTTASCPKVNWELPPPVPKTTSEPRFRPRPALAAVIGHPAFLSHRDDSRYECRYALEWHLATSPPFDAILSPAVPMAAMARTPCWLASPTMLAIAAIVRSMAASMILPLERPSPSGSSQPDRRRSAIFRRRCARRRET